ncbi:uncharacterized protein LOC110060723 [Orbicella faveolata]|uniref:uncharacterized protein LOC110060723 n=1 Tax=Orbicella faveolata TaxID=48498 RepID=UPI0009E2C1D3|nr:uncharacterized protein LOC110060723 [Orbicella faveolata]
MKEGSSFPPHENNPVFKTKQTAVFGCLQEKPQVMSTSRRPRLCTEYYRKAKTSSSNTRRCNLKRDKPWRKCNTGDSSMKEKDCGLEIKEVERKFDMCLDSALSRLTRKQDKKLSTTRNLGRKRSYNLTSSHSQGGNFNCYIRAVPDEVLLLICSYLQEKELCRMSQTCTRLNTICQDGCLWFVVNGLIFILHSWS